MARVLKYGKVQPRQTLCPNCDAVIEYTNADLDFTSLYHKFDEDKIGLKCPACGKVMLIEYYRDGQHYLRKEDGKFHIIERYEYDDL